MIKGQVVLTGSRGYVGTATKELLDKMIDQGIESLTKVEKQKLEQYSK